MSRWKIRDYRDNTVHVIGDLTFSPMPVHPLVGRCCSLDLLQTACRRYKLAIVMYLLVSLCLHVSE